MFEYGPSLAQTAVAPPGRRGADPFAAARKLIDLAARRWRLVATAALAGALAAFAVAKTLPPRYVATAQIYVDPTGAPGSDRAALAPGQDSTGFLNYVESQALIVKSRSVLERVAASEKLDADPEFASSSLFGFLFGGTRGEAAKADAIGAAARALDDRVTVRRPERTFVLDLQVSARSAERAAELANATARAYIESVAAMQGDAARLASATLAKKIESLRGDVIAAERKIEDYKAANGLVGARDALVVDQQLKDVNSQLGAVRARMAETKSRADEIDAARRRGGDYGPSAAQLNLGSLGPLRAQQSQARQRLAELADLGPLHPQRIEAQQRAAAADSAVEAELARMAQSQRNDYARARATEASLARQLEALKRATLADGESEVGLRDLERDAASARALYERFVTRLHEAGDLQQIEPPRAKVISLAVPPKARAFPPGATSIAGLGLLLGALAGLAAAFWREGRGATGLGTVPGVEARDASPEGAGGETPAPAVFAITGRSALKSRSAPQSLRRLDLVRLGVPTLAEGDDASEFQAILGALDLDRRHSPGERAALLAVAGPNADGLRSAMALTLALTAARGGLRVGLVDAAGRNARLTRAVRRAVGSPVLDAGVVFDAGEGIALGLPKAFDAELGRLSAPELLRRLGRARDDGLDLVIADGPAPEEFDAAETLRLADAILGYGLDARATARLPGMGGARRASAIIEAAPADAAQPSAARKLAQ